jgi:hypothetical protein
VLHGKYTCAAAANPPSKQNWDSSLRPPDEFTSIFPSRADTTCGLALATNMVSLGSVLWRTRALHGPSVKASKYFTYYACCRVINAHLSRGKIQTSGLVPLTHRLMHIGCYIYLFIYLSVPPTTDGDVMEGGSGAQGVEHRRWTKPRVKSTSVHPRADAWLHPGGQATFCTMVVACLTCHAMQL